MFVNLERRPDSPLEAYAVAQAICNIPKDSFGGSLSLNGEVPIGMFVRPDTYHGGCVALRHGDLAAFMLSLMSDKPVLRFPRLDFEIPLNLAPLAVLGDRGLLYRDINDPAPRGAFDMYPLESHHVPTYPALWAHDQHRERYLEVHPDREARARQDQTREARDKWKRTASRLHFTRDFRVNSQSLAACLTPEPTIGGAAWPNFLVADELWEPLLVLWANSTLGLMLWWWLGTRQQPGRARLTLSRLPDLPVLDPRVLTEAQLTRTRHLYDDFKGRVFLPAYAAYRDETRQALDRMVLVELLGLPAEILPELDLLRRQWCEEPSVYGSESKAPPGR